MNLDNDILYEENILQHSRNPKNKVEGDFVCDIKSDCLCGIGDNPSCGDNAKLFLKKVNDKMDYVTWSGNGCAISQSAMSMMTEKINFEIQNKNLKIEDLKLWSPAIIYDMLGVRISPSRANCALLPYRCLEDLLKKYEIRN